jgi:twinkle protein
LIAHPFKMVKDEKTGKYKVPTLYSINGSSNFFNKTHNGMCVYRNPDGTTEIYIQKVKFYWLGQTGWISYRFDTNTRQYHYQSCSLATVNGQESKKEAQVALDLPEGNWKKIEGPSFIDNEETN